MPVSKRLRFEILRRDKHTCRYCGRSAPDVVLTVDHVVPTVLGGSDEPSNLVTACMDCNAGKTSSAPDQGTVDSVSDDALRWATAMRRAAEELSDQIDSRAEIHAAVLDAWPSYRRKYLPVAWMSDVDTFLDAGLPAHVIVQMASLAGGKQGVSNRWSYFCGCCWTRIRQMQERAAEIIAEEENGG